MQNECYKAIESLRRNEETQMDRRDKRSGIAVANVLGPKRGAVAPPKFSAVLLDIFISELMV